MEAKLFNRNFTMVVIGQIISLFGNTIFRFSMSLYILDVTGSAAIFGTITAISMIPTILLSPIGGMLSDRVNKRNIMVALDFTTAALILAFAFILPSGGSLIVTACVMIAMSVIQSFYTPSVQASVPVLQSEDNLVKANAVISQVTMLSNLTGPVLGGMLYGAAGLMPIVYLSALSFFLSAILEIFIHIPFVKSGQGGNLLTMMKSDISDSVRFMYQDEPDILKSLPFIAAVNFFLSSCITIGLPYMVLVVSKLDSSLYGLAEGLMAAAGIAGGLATGLMAGRLSMKRMYLFLVFAGAFMLPAALIYFVSPAHITAFAVASASFMAVQVSAVIFSIFGLSSIQRKTPKHLLGKVTSLITTLCMCAIPLGQAFYGFFIEACGNSVYIPLAFTAIVTAIIGFAGKNIFARLVS